MTRPDTYQAARYVEGKRDYVDIAWRKDGHSHRVRHYFDHVKHKPTRDKQAREYVRNINRKLAEGWRPGDSDEAMGHIMLRDVLRIVLDIKKHYGRLRSKQTYQSHYRALMELVAIECGDHVRCADFGPMEARRVMDALIRYRRPSGTTFNNYLTSYRGWFNELVRRGHYADNPFAEIKPMKAERTENRVFTDAELMKVVEHLEAVDPWFLLACELLYYCGIRRSELVGLFVAAVDLDRCVIQVPGRVAKNGHPRAVALPLLLRDRMAIMLAGADPGHYLFGQGIRPGAVKAWPNRLSERWAKVRAELKLAKNLQFYGLKDTAAERLTRAGVDVARIRDLYDHSSIAITDAYLKKTTGKVDHELAKAFPKMG